MTPTLPPVPPPSADLEAEARSIRGERAAVTLAYRAIQRAKQWERRCKACEEMLKPDEQVA